MTLIPSCPNPAFNFGEGGKAKCGFGYTSQANFKFFSTKSIQYKAAQLNNPIVLTNIENVKFQDGAR
jgi:hypothetical protein